MAFLALVQVVQEGPVDDALAAYRSLLGAGHLAGLRAVAKLYLNGADPRDPLASPLSGDLRGLPPLLLQVGGLETLYDDTKRFADQAQAAGVGGAVKYSSCFPL